VGAEFAGPPENGGRKKNNRLKINRSCIFQHCDLVRHFPGHAFSRPCILSRPNSVHILEILGGKQ